MSTAVPFALDENTTTRGDNSEKDNTIRSAKPGTDLSSSEENEPQLKSSHTRRAICVASPDKMELIKQRWSGVVLDSNNKELTARLEDLTNPENPDEIVVLSLEEIESADHPLIQAGAMFLWHIGYRYGTKYPRERFSKIRFRRLAHWTHDEIQDARKQAQEYSDYFSVDPNPTA
ncbi:MAG: hypothetical protein ACU843_07825 [Gammaproteobacteria bacterium]